MVFGEIVEPSSRALLYEEELESAKCNLEWKKDCKVPDKINTFLVVDTVFLADLLKKSLLKNKSPYVELKNADVKLYFNNNIAICVCRCNENIGAITEKLIPWTQNSTEIYAMTTSSISSYQPNKDDLFESLYFLRRLTANTTSEKLQNIKTLGVPNLVSGLGSSIFTYCKVIDKPCQLVIGYIDTTPLDSVNSARFLTVLRDLKIGEVSDIQMQPRGTDSNLYM